MDNIVSLVGVDIEDLKSGDVFVWKCRTEETFHIHTYHSDAGYGVKTFTDYDEERGTSVIVNYSGICGILIPNNGEENI